MAPAPATIPLLNDHRYICMYIYTHMSLDQSQVLPLLYLHMLLLHAIIQEACKKSKLQMLLIWTSA